jgi:GH15 family glucan-1,4-alpha-glucosidase
MNLVPAGRAADALVAARRCALDWIRNTGEALALKDLGHPEEARAALERLIARNADDSAYQIAEVYAWQGQTPAWRSTAPAPWSSSSRRR